MLLPAYKILMVEDSFIDAESCKRALSQIMDGDATLHHANTMGEAERYLAGKTHYDIILLDLSLPDTEDRVDSFMRIDQAKSIDTPVLITTSMEHKGLAKKMLGFGAQDYLTKKQILNRPESVQTAISFAITRHKKFGEHLHAQRAQSDELMRYISGAYCA